MKQNKPGAAFGVKAETGLSLKELLVTLIITLLGNLVIIMIVLAIALLSFQRAYNSFRLSGAARDVRDIVWIARSEAINRNKSVDLVVQTSSSDPTRTNIWTDPDRDGKLDPGEKVFLLGPQENLIDSSGVPGTASLLLQAVNGAGAATPLPTSSKITFDARGSVTSLNVNVYYLASAAAGAGYRAVIVTPSGAVQIWTADTFGEWQPSQ